MTMPTTQTMPPGQRPKPIELEGVLDLYLIQPIGTVLTRALMRTPVTPNGVSWLSVVAAFGAAFAYYQPTWFGASLGTALLLLSSGLDSADGQLARATGRTSELGETLDGFCDSLSFGAIYVAAVLSLIWRFDISAWVAFPFGIVAGFSHSFQSAMVDFVRQAYAYTARGRGRIEREDPVRLQGELARARREGETPLQVLLRWIRVNYCQMQQAWLSPSMAIVAAVRDAQGNDARQRQIAAIHRDAMRGMLHAWTLMAPNCHKVAIAVCAFLPLVLPNSAIAAYGLALVLVFNLALNVVLALLVWAQRRVDRAVLARIAVSGIRS